MRLILASGSKNRQELLKIAGIKYKIAASNIDETEVQDRDPKKRVVKVAKAKAEAEAPKHTNSLILAADSYGLYRNKSLEKPKFKTEAFETLKMLAGTSFLFMTGWHIINTKTKQTYSGRAETRIFVRDVPEQQLLDYVNDHDVTQWAVGISPMNTSAIRFIKKIEGSVSSYSHGLPLEQVLPVLESEGVI